MFGRKPPAGSGETTPPADRPAPAFQPAAARPATAAPPRPAPVGEGSDAPSAPRLGLATAPAAASAPGQPLRRPAEPIRPAEPAREVRKLIVGRDITLSGEIGACDHLIVEGTVEASVKDCHRLEVLEAGLFRGTVEIQEAEIAGRFDGQIVVQGRLSVRATGRIEGKIQYGELAVEAGGTLDGEVRGHTKKAAAPKAKPEAEAPLLDQPAVAASSEEKKPADDAKAS